MPRVPYRLIPPGRRSCWYIRGTFGGCRHDCSTGQTDQEAATIWAANYYAGVISNPLPKPGQTVTFDRATEAFIAWKRPNRSEEKLLRTVASWFNKKPLAEVMHAHAVEAANALKPRATGPTRNRKIIVPIAAVMHYAAKQGWVEYRRFEKFRESRRSPRAPASDAAVAALMAETTGYKQAILAVLYETGLRVTDAINIEWAAVNLPAGRLLARAGKTDDRVAIPLSAALVAMLANLPKSPRYVFPWRTRRGVYAWLKPLCERLGVTYTPHQSRHALATAALEAGIPDREAADLGAWSDTRSLHRYQHVQAKGVAGRSVGNLVGTGGVSGDGRLQKRS